MKFLITVLLGLSVGCACLPARAACSLGLGDKVSHVQLKAESGFAALLLFGYEHGVCLGIENPGLGLLKGGRQIYLSNATVNEIVRRILGSESYQITESQGVVLIRNSEALKRSSVLDNVLPEYTIPKMSLPWASEAIRMRLVRLADPSKGYAGSLSDRLPQETTGPLSLGGRTVRDILTGIVGGSSGAAWVSGRCAGKYRNDVSPCWNFFQYQENRRTFEDLLSFILDRFTREESGLPRVVP